MQRLIIQISNERSDPDYLDNLENDILRSGYSIESIEHLRIPPHVFGLPDVPDSGVSVDGYKIIVNGADRAELEGSMDGYNCRIDEI